MFASMDSPTQSTRQQTDSADLGTSAKAGADLAPGAAVQVASSRGGSRGGSGIPLPGVTAGVVIDFKKLEAGGSIDIFPANTPWPKIPIPPLPYPLCNVTPSLSVAVEYAGGGDFAGNPNAYFTLGLAGRLVLTGQVEGGPCKAGIEAALGVKGALTLRGTQQNWSVEGEMGYEGQVNLIAQAGWAQAKLPVCSGMIGEMAGISFNGKGHQLISSRQPSWKWGNGIQRMIDFVQGKRADGGGSTGEASAVASAADSDSDQPAMAA
jgi:hypothetical protein